MRVIGDTGVDPGSIRRTHPVADCQIACKALSRAVMKPDIRSFTVMGEVWALPVKFSMRATREVRAVDGAE